MKELKLSTSNKVALIDDEDFDRCLKLKWRLHPSGYVYHSKYSYLGFKKYKTEIVYLHVFITEKNQQDHINRNKLDCQKKNLRDSNPSLNTANQGKFVNQFTTSKYKGVCWDKHKNKWKAYIKRMSLGLFLNEIDAALAYDNACKKMYGEFAVLNFPNGTP